MPRLLSLLLSFVWPLLVGVCLGVGLLGLYNQYLQRLKPSFLSPLAANPEVLATSVGITQPLIGFLPYWLAKKAVIPYDQIDTLAYFGVSLAADGTIVKRQNGEWELGWYNLNQEHVQRILTQAEDSGLNRMIVITAFDNEVIDTLISNSGAKSSAIASIRSLVESGQWDSVNIDFEYNLAYPTNPKSSQNLPLFIKALKDELKKIRPGIEVSLDIYANGFIHNHPYDVKALSEVADQLILMGYDFHRPASAKAGPVAPMRSHSGPSITKALEAAFEKQVPSEKIILAMPLYGYEWQTVNDKFAAATYPQSGALATYKRVHQLLQNDIIPIQWDHVAMSPWLVYTKDRHTYQIYYENDQSLGLKLQLINQANLGGGAFWALGYEGESAPVWQVVSDWRKKHN